MAVTIAAGTTSRPHFVPAGSIVKVTPAAGASAIVEYTRGSLVEIANGVATWAAWPKGAVSAETSDLSNNPVSVRVTAQVGAVSLDIDTSPSAARMAAFRSDWGKPGSDTTSLAKYSPSVSQYERALIFAAPPRQGGAVKGFSRNFNDAQYCMTLGAAAANLVSDADIYDCEPGALTVGMSYNAGTPAAYSAKALAFQWRKMLWDLDAGDSLFLQARVKTVGATGNQTLFGNSNGTTEGFGVVLNLAGTVAFNFKAANTAAQSIQIQGVQFDGTNVVSNTIATDTYFNLTIHVDGDTKKLDAWVNGIPAAGNTGGAGNGYGSGGTVLNAGTTIPASPHNFGFGYIPSDDSFTPASVKPTRIQAFRMAVLPTGKKVRSPAFLDWLFNNNPRALFDDAAYFSE